MSRSTSSRDGDEDDLDQDDEQSEQGFGLFDEPTKVEELPDQIKTCYCFSNKEGALLHLI